MAGPRTSYGGGRSVWIRKKKKRQSYDGDGVGDDQPAADPMNTSATTSSSSSSTENDDSSTDGSDSSPATTTGTATSSKLIGWDETLCRPIYELVPNQDNADDDNHGDDGKDSDEEEDDASASSGGLSMALSLESSQESLSSVLGCEDGDESTGRGTMMTRPTSSRRSRAVRSYGSRKRGRAGLSAAAEAVLLDGEHDAAEDIPERTAKRAKKETTGSGTSKKRVFGGRKAISNTDKASATTRRAARTAVPSPSKTDVTVNTDESSASSMLTPQPYGNGICNVLDSDVQKSAVSGVGASGSDFAQAALATSDNTSMEEGQQPILDLGQQQKTKPPRRQYGGNKLQPRKSTTTTIDDGDSASSTKRSELDFSGSGEDDDRSTKIRPKLTQPSGQSSLSAARAFFEQLDETSELSVENKDVLLSPELRRHRRGADGTVAAACVRTSRTAGIDDPKLVAEYEQYCKSSDITPLPLREYVIHRNSFFNSSTTICDGLLDDN